MGNRDVFFFFLSPAELPNLEIIQPRIKELISSKLDLIMIKKLIITSKLHSQLLDKLIYVK